MGKPYTAVLRRISDGWQVTLTTTVVVSHRSEALELTGKHLNRFYVPRGTSEPKSFKSVDLQLYHAAQDLFFATKETKKNAKLIRTLGNALDEYMASLGD